MTWSCIVANAKPSSMPIPLNEPDSTAPDNSTLGFFVSPVTFTTPVTQPVAWISLPTSGRNGTMSTSFKATCKSACPSRSKVPPIAMSPSPTGSFKVVILNLRFARLASIVASPTTLSSILTSLILPLTVTLGLSFVPPISTEPFNLPSRCSFSRSNSANKFLTLPLVTSKTPNNRLLSSSFMPPLAT